MSHPDITDKMLISFDDCNLKKDDQSIIRCIFFSEFHHIAGPKITCQVPDNFVSKDIFDNVSVYIIPKAQLQRSIITVTLKDYKILGFPVIIDDNKYARNAFYFNLCFVCDAGARTVHYESVVQKMTDFLMGLEMENKFLSNCTDDKKRLSEMLKQIMNDLNSHKMSIVTEGTMTTHLKVIRLAQEPRLVVDHQVPIFLEDKENYKTYQWDLTTLNILEYINGYNHISKISVLSGVDNALVKNAIQNLIYYGIVKIIPIFQYSHFYATTPMLKEFAKNEYLQDKCIDYSSESSDSPALFRDCYRFYASMKHGTSIAALCERLDPELLGIDERRLVQFGLIAGIIRRVYKFPIYIKGTNSDNEDDNEIQKDAIYKYFNGKYSLDQICCLTGQSTENIEKIIEADTDITM
ncbi:GATOR complex protein NPRL2, partial [Aphidius gifuensis]